MKDFESFKVTITKFQDLVSKITSKPLEGCVALLLGRFCFQTGDFSNAEKHLQRALEIFQGLDEKLNIGKSYYYLGCMESHRNKKKPWGFLNLSVPRVGPKKLWRNSVGVN